MVEHPPLQSRIVMACAMVLALFSPTALRAESLTVAWDPNPERDVVGYYVYIGTSPGIYTTTVDVGSATSFTFGDARPGTTYFVSVAAYVPGPVFGPRADELATTTEGGPSLVNPGNRTSPLGSPVTLRLDASDPNADPITFGALGLPPGLSLNPLTGSLTGTPSMAGRFDVSITATDDHANIAAQHFAWTVVVPDLAPPAVAITGPTPAATFRTASAFVTLTGTATDDIGVTSVTWASAKAGSGHAAGTGVWSVIVPLTPGVNRISVTARDDANRTATDVIDVTMATDQLPVVNILKPTAAAAYATAAGTIALTGSSSDDGAIQTVRWSNDRGGSGVATGRASWSASGIRLYEGTNVLTVTAQDNAGQTSTDTITVSWRPAPLVLTTLTSSKPAPQRSWALVTFTANASGGRGPYQYQWWLFDGERWTVRQAWSSRSTWRWVPERANPNYVVRVQVRSAGSTVDEPETGSASTTVAFPIRPR